MRIELSKEEVMSKTFAATIHFLPPHGFPLFLVTIK